MSPYLDPVPLTRPMDVWLIDEWPLTRIGYVVVEAECAQSWREYVDVLDALTQLNASVQRGLAAAGYMRAQHDSQ